jgi:hypothetical protein
MKKPIFTPSGHYSTCVYGHRINLDLMIIRNSKFSNSDNVMVKLYDDRTTISKEHKIVIIGDSHSRGEESSD